MPDTILAAARTDPAVRISLPPAPGMVTLRGDLASAPVREAVLAATGLALPDRRRVVAGEGYQVAWMSPDELLLVTPPDGGQKLAKALGRALGDRDHLVVDVSAARRVFSIEGTGARAVLAKGAPVDLRPEAFGPGDFRRTRLGQVAVAFWMPDATRFDLVCFRSVAAFVAEWLATAAAPGSLPRGEVFPAG
jgi:sarcosine oxidase subunit gamma